MDAIDRKILALLQADGRMTLTYLAGQVQLSVSRCQRRVRELERSGTIQGYRAIVDPELMGFGFEVIAFATLMQAGTVDEFDAAIAEVPEIVEAQRLFGEPDYLLRIVAVDRKSYQAFYDKTLTRLPGLRGLNSTFVMKQAVPSRPLPDLKAARGRTAS
ncbi:Lrp/AsnC family transcriptional regulator [Leucobacter ruminantium]|uniref:Lrp/AsnC family transcriptional regulator n=1 Tax=Leucobacter ruminantium TaxID=1289170 RepID=A0A939RTM1_9MICO|nr:Lrp/AsnC family transcriptional regulator [Leucobacter ruminantium]MBO1804530.1 Lrp/AsnC family transcriptional regulator [Leucobacter ruminantium]